MLDMTSAHILCLGLDRPEQQDCSCTAFDQPFRETCIHLLRKRWVRVHALLGFERVFVEPFHEGKMETRPLIEELRRVKMQVAERRNKEAALRYHPVGRPMLL